MPTGATDQTLDLVAANGLRKVALGIESGNERVLRYICFPAPAERLPRREPLLGGLPDAIAVK